MPVNHGKLTERTTIRALIAEPYLILTEPSETLMAPYLDMSWHPWYTTFSSDKDMTTTFADFQMQQDARNTIHLNIVKYSLMLCDALTADANHLSENYGFELDSSGRKYHKIFMYINGRRDSIHAFIDKTTGDVFKPASIKAPAKHARFNLLSISSREDCLARASWAGGYLYLR